MTENKYEIRIIRSSRKTMSLEITRDLQVVVRAPYRVSEKRIRQFVQEKSPWIEKHLIIMREKLEKQKVEPQERLSPEEIRRLAEKALQVIPKRTAFYAERMGVSYGRITIRNQKTRWGSCSSTGNLNFNCLLMLVPDRVLDYVVVHELCHRKEMNHSPRFWKEVEQVLPDYKEQRAWLKENGGRLIVRMTGSAG